MIQRIQTLFLAISLAAGILLFFFPIASFWAETSFHQLFLTSIRNLTPDSPVLFKNLFTLPLLICQLLCLALTLACIFMYRNRAKQMRLAKINILLCLLLVVGIFFIYPEVIERVLVTEADFEFAAYFPLASLLFLVLAYRYIARDEALVRSSDRMR
jgi:glucan phosphoethanolaminetransferase (alkaline phosphatase superfamily)